MTDTPKPRRGHHEGSFLERDGKIRVQLIVHGQRLSHTARNRTEARAWARKTVEDANKGILPARAGTMTVGEHLDRWLEITAPSLRPKTIEQYSSVIRLHLKPDLGRVHLTYLRSDQVQALSAKKLKTHAPRTVQLMLVIFHHALKDAVRWNLLARNVCEAVTAPKVTRKEMRSWDPEQAKAFLGSLAGDRWESLYWLALSCGLRLGELLGLRWADVDLESGRLQVRRTLARIGKGTGLTVGEPKTSKGRRSVTLSEATVASLRRWRKTQVTEQLLAGPRWVTSGYVFTSHVGTPTEPRTLKADFPKKTATANLPRIRFHDLRHTCATLLLGQGVHPKVVQEMLGHSQISLTLDTYSHVLPTMQSEAAKAIDRVLSGN